MLHADYNPEFKIRRSQLLTPYGVGSLIDINNQSLMISDSEYWDLGVEENVFHDIRLEKLLNSSGFVQPPVLENKKEISGKRFPKWFYSPKDRSLKKIDEWADLFYRNNKNKSNVFHDSPFDARDNNRTPLVPVRIICACKNGHAQDFPWLEWVHGTKVKSKHQHKLKLKSSGQSSSISDLSVNCETCNISKKLTNIFDVEKFNKTINEFGVTCNGEYLWKKDEINSTCKSPLQVLLKNANNFYFPNIVSSVNIPFEKNILFDKIINNENFPALRKEIEREINQINSVNDFKKNPFINRQIDFLCKDFTESKNKIIEEIYNNLIEDKESYEDISIMEYRKNEFKVLTGEEKYNTKDNRLHLNIISEQEFKDSKYGRLIDSITLVHKLEVASVLKSYSRIRPPEKSFSDENEDTLNNDAKEISLRRNDSKYVGIELSGEGIFISLSANSIKDWLSKISNTKFADNIYNKVNNSTMNINNAYICPEYYMLHTLSHILIKELSETSGYSSSALAERLYFSNEESDKMYGILIYTSSSDSEGTLGGLVKQGYPENFLQLLDSCIEKARWCSFDPVCINTHSQGRDSLNGSACHACSLISETSCEHGNLYLDRSMLVGNLKKPDYGFFN